MPKSRFTLTAEQRSILQRLGAIFLESRQDKGLSAFEIARIAGVDRFSVRRLELGRVDARLVTHFLPLCRALGLDPATVLVQVATPPATSKARKSKGVPRASEKLQQKTSRLATTRK